MKSYSNDLVDSTKLKQMHDEQQKEINLLKKQSKSHCLAIWVLVVLEFITFIIALISLKGM